MAVALTTCERYEYTAETVSAFCRFNAEAIAAGWLVLLHADDASEDRRVLDVVRDHGFETVGVHERRMGAQATRRTVVSAALARGLAFTMLLENDWVMVRPLPWAMIDYFASRDDCYTMRFFGPLRERHGDGWPCSTTHAGRGNADPDWRPVADAPEPAEIGSIHMSTAPCCTRTRQLMSMLLESMSASDMMRASGKIDKLTLRCLDNVGWHFGHGPDHTTPHFKR
ncbi:MAG: hypothetical protein KF723_22115 [Rhizobiaceae bacterium]|nr:hypothetical protein [Rhizobiaceae bacterium]